MKSIDTKNVKSKSKLLLALIVTVSLLAAGTVYYFAVVKTDSPTTTDGQNQVVKQQSVPKEVQSAGDELMQIDRTLDTDLNAAELDQDIDTLL